MQGGPPIQQALLPYLFCLSLMIIPGAAAQASEDCTLMAGQTINWIVPSKPGGGYDAYSRLLQPYLEKRLAARIVIENHPDAGGIVGAVSIRDARADGRTIGIINASGLLAAGLMGQAIAPRPARDFTIIGRLVSNRMVLLTGRNSGLKTIGDVLRTSSSRSLLIGVRDAGSASFIAIPVMAVLIDLNYDLVSGYVGSPTRALAAIRGEIDLIIQDSGSIGRFVEDGELIPLLQVTQRERPVSSDHANDWLENVPLLEDIAVQRKDHTGLEPKETRQMAAALSSIIGAGRLIVGPAGMPEPLATCLVSALSATLDSSPLREAAKQAGLEIAPAGPDVTRRDLQAGSQALNQFSTLVRSAIAQTRQ
jgi:tripartite-type tricarboxylate transporter receptor subunit TctC